MEFRKDFYKYTRLTSVAEQRARRSERLCNARVEERMKLLENRRGPIEDEETLPVPVNKSRVEISTKVLPPPSPVKKKSRAEMLQEWKLQKLKRMEEMRKKQKPIFKVGVVHRKATGSPLTNISNIINNKPVANQKPMKGKIEAPAGVVTRAKAKLLKPTTPPKQTQFLRAVKNKMKPINRHAFVLPKAVAALPTLTIPFSPNITKSSKKVKKTKAESPRKIDFDVSIVIEENKNVPDKLKEMEVTSTSDEMENLEDKMKSVSIPHTPEDQIASTKKEDYVPIHYSPYVTMSRGSVKKSPRNSKIRLTMDVNQQIQKEENEHNCRIFSFRKFVECETKRLLEKCEEWEKIKQTERLSEDVNGEISAVIGKTKLLTSDKFKQFKDLIEKCAQNDPMIKIDDLQGFQDWVALEVDKIDSSFVKLEEGKNNNFAKKEVDKPKATKTVVNKENKVPSKQPVGKPAGSSNMRAHILAARKLMRQNATEMSPLKSLPTWAEALSPSKKTPKRKDSLMKSVLTSETKKINGPRFDSPRTPKQLERRNSGLEILTATQIAKSLSTPGKSPETETNLNSTATSTSTSTSASSSSEASFINFKPSSTPGKGILKSTPSQSSSKRSVMFRLSTSMKSPFASPKVGISDKYLAPPEETDESVDCDSPIRMRDSTPTGLKCSSNSKRRSRMFINTPVRKSARLANK